MRICVFCGSSMGTRPVHQEAARELGRCLAERGVGLVYGGAQVGLMGVVADAALAAGGEVLGVIPRALQDRELAHRRLTELHVVDSMHARKAKMAELSDAFVALPGGLGTLEELFEVWTWATIGIHQKPCGVLNVARFYDPLLGLLDALVSEGFVAPVCRNMLVVAETPAALLEGFQRYVPPPDRWSARGKPSP